MISKIDKNSVRKARHDRTRRYISGTQERPRLNVYRSLNNIYVQIIDDVAGNTIASASTLDPEVKAQLEGKTKKEAAKLVGELVGKRDCLGDRCGHDDLAVVVDRGACDLGARELRDLPLKLGGDRLGKGAAVGQEHRRGEPVMLGL